MNDVNPGSGSEAKSMPGDPVTYAQKKANLSPSVLQACSRRGGRNRLSRPLQIDEV